MLSMNYYFVLTEKWVGAIWEQQLILGFKYIIAELARAKRAQHSANTAAKRNAHEHKIWHPVSFLFPV